MLRQILVFTILLIMFSCSSTNKTSINTGNNKSDVTLYKEGMKYLKAKDFENYLTSMYGKGNMDNVEWDIWEPPEEEGLEEIELEPETEVGKYLKKKMKRKRS